MADASLGNAVLRTQVDNTGLKSGLDAAGRQVEAFGGSAGRNLQNLGRSLVGVGQSLTLGLTAPLTAAGIAIVKAASDAEETASKFATVYRVLGDGAERAADQLATSFGLSSTNARRLLGDTGDLLTGFGFTADAALDLSINVNELAVDLASFTNFSGGAEGASAALTKALLGETESLKSLGIAIRQVDVEAKVLELTQQGLTFESEQQAKAYATLAIAQEQSKNAIGDFERTSGSFANQLRILRSNLDDAAVGIGTILLPAATEAVTAFSGLVTKFTELSEPTQRFILVASGIAAALGPAILVTGGLITNVGALIVAVPKVVLGFTALKGVLAGFLGPAGLLIVGAAAATAFAIKLARDRNDRSALEGAANAAAAALASGDRGSLVGALDVLISKVDGEASAKLQAFRDNLAFEPDVSAVIAGIDDIIDKVDGDARVALAGLAERLRIDADPSNALEALDDIIGKVDGEVAASLLGLRGYLVQSADVSAVIASLDEIITKVDGDTRVALEGLTERLRIDGDASKALEALDDIIAKADGEVAESLRALRGNLVQTADVTAVLASLDEIIDKVDGDTKTALEGLAEQLKIDGDTTGAVQALADIAAEADENTRPAIERIIADFVRFADAGEREIQRVLDALGALNLYRMESVEGLQTALADARAERDGLLARGSAGLPQRQQNQEAELALINERVNTALINAAGTTLEQLSNRIVFDAERASFRFDTPPPSLGQEASAQIAAILADATTIARGSQGALDASVSAQIAELDLVIGELVSVLAQRGFEPPPNVVTTPPPPTTQPGEPEARGTAAAAAAAAAVDAGFASVRAVFDDLRDRGIASVQLRERETRAGLEAAEALVQDLERRRTLIGNAKQTLLRDFYDTVTDAELAYLEDRRRDVDSEIVRLAARGVSPDVAVGDTRALPPPAPALLPFAAPPVEFRLENADEIGRSITEAVTAGDVTDRLVGPSEVITERVPVPEPRVLLPDEREIPDTTPLDALTGGLTDATAALRDLEVISGGVVTIFDSFGDLVPPAVRPTPVDEARPPSFVRVPLPDAFLREPPVPLQVDAGAFEGAVDALFARAADEALARARALFDGLDLTASFGRFGAAGGFRAPRQTVLPDEREIPDITPLGLLTASAGAAADDLREVTRASGGVVTLFNSFTDLIPPAVRPARDEPFDPALRALPPVQDAVVPAGALPDGFFDRSLGLFNLATGERVRVLEGIFVEGFERAADSARAKIFEFDVDATRPTGRTGAGLQLGIDVDAINRATNAGVRARLTEAERDRRGQETEAARIAREQQAAANRFSQTIVDSAFAFTGELVRAVRDGDIGAAFQSALGAAGSILGAANLGTLPLLGGSIGIGTLISGALGLVSTLVGLFSPGQSQREQDRVRAAGVSPRGAPAIEFNVNVQQSLNVQSLTDPASRNAVNGLLNETVARITRVIEANVIPRIQRLEGAAL